MQKIIKNMYGLKRIKLSDFEQNVDVAVFFSGFGTQRS
jgi:hypothetical protein